MKIWQKALLFFAELVVLCVVVVAWYIVDKFGKLEVKEIDREAIDLIIAPEVKANEALKGYTNYLLLGTDARDNSLEAMNKTGEGNTDAIIIASLNNDTKEVKLVSVYRDTYLSIGDGKYKKANAAYAAGGAKQAVQMLNSNLDLDIKDYVCVDWAAMVEVIDDLGGLDLNITQAEMQQINKYKKDIDKVTGYSTPALTQYGNIHLDGTQATTYARIRKLAGDDYKRASRQRIVLQAILEKAKKSDIGTLTSICNSVVDDISTSLSISQILSLAKDVKSYKVTSTTGFPFHLTNKDMAVGDSVIPADLTLNVRELHEYMLDDPAYVPSQTVQAISSTIVNNTGITAESSTVDTSEYNETVGISGTEGLKKPAESN